MVKAERIQCDEIWAFCYAKKKNVETAKNPPPFAGDIWTWTAIDPKSKLIVSYQIGDRTIETGEKFMKDLQSRLAYRVQLTTDGLGSYEESVDKGFRQLRRLQPACEIFQVSDEYSRWEIYPPHRSH